MLKYRPVQKWRSVLEWRHEKVTLHAKVSLRAKLSLCDKVSLRAKVTPVQKCRCAILTPTLWIHSNKLIIFNWNKGYLSSIVIKILLVMLYKIFVIVFHIKSFQDSNSLVLYFLLLIKCEIGTTIDINQFNNFISLLIKL